MAVKKAKREIDKYEDKESFEAISKREIVKICQLDRIPYFGLKKIEMIENMMAVKENKKPPHKDLTKSWADRRGINHELTPRMRKFCLDYAIAPGAKTAQKWAKEHGVSYKMIQVWLTWPDIRRKIEEFKTSIEDRVKEIVSQNSEDMIKELLKIAKSSKITPEKRKAINDILDFFGVFMDKKIRSRINVSQIASSSAEATSASSISKLSLEELEKEAGELDTLIDSSKKKKK